MKLKDKIYATIALVAIIISMVLVTEFAYNCGVNNGEYTGYHAGYEKGYETGYDDGNWDGKNTGMKYRKEEEEELIKWCGITGDGYEQIIDGKTYKVKVEKVDK